MISTQLPERWVAVDTETAHPEHKSALDPWRGARPFAACVVFPNGTVKYWRDDFTGLKEIMEDPTIDKVMHNAKFDWRMLEFIGIQTKGMVWDTMIFGHLLDGRQRQSLDALTRKYVPDAGVKQTDEIMAWLDTYKPKGRKLKKDEKGNYYDMVPPELMKKYCIQDTVITAKLFKRVYTAVASTMPRLLEQEHKLLPIVKRMEDYGMHVDPAVAAEQQIYLDGVVEDCQQFCAGITDNDYFSFNSYSDVMGMLERCGLVGKLKDKTPSGKFKTDARALRALSHPASAMLLLGKQAKDLRNKFINQILEYEIDGILHPGLNQTGTLSGRFSSSKPNLLNIPAEGGHLTPTELAEQIDLTGYDLAPAIKSIFTTRPGMTHIHADKSKVEVAMLGHYTKDPTLVGILNDPSKDLHGEISQRMFNSTDKSLRVRSKAVVFGIIYGAGDAVIAKNVQGSIADAKEYRRLLMNICPGITRWQHQLKEQLHDNGYIVTDYGRRHYLYRGEDYMCINRMCQSTAADEVKSRMIYIDNWLQSEFPDAHMMLQIHDDIVTEAPDELVPDMLPKYKELMEEQTIPYNVPLPADLEIAYDHWGNLKKVSFTEDNKPIMPERILDEVA